MSTFWMRDGNILVNEAKQPLICDECPCVDETLRLGENHLGVHSRGCLILKASISPTPTHWWGIESITWRTAPDFSDFSGRKVWRWPNYIDASQPFSRGFNFDTTQPDFFYEDGACRTSLYFDGVDAFMTTQAAVSRNMPLTVIMVCKPNSAGSVLRVPFGGLATGISDGRVMYLAQTTSDLWRPSVGPISPSQFNGPAVDVGNWQVVSTVFDTSNSRCRVNDDTAVTGSLTGTSFNKYGEIGRLHLFATSYWDGLIGEVMTFHSALSTTDELAIVSVLMDKWNIV